MGGCVTSHRPPSFAAGTDTIPSGTRSSDAGISPNCGEPAWQQVVRQLRERVGKDGVTLLTAAKDLEHSQAAVLAHWLNRAEGSRSGE
jgi:hypothetical protein